jgi:integrase
MPPVVSKALRVHRDRQTSDQRNESSVWNELGLVFTRADGNPLDGTVVSHQFHRILDRAELLQRRFHDLRHSCATLLMAQHVSPRVVMEILGHSQIGVTMNTYSHVIPELGKSAAKKMESLLAERDR